MGKIGGKLCKAKYRRIRANEAKAKRFQHRYGMTPSEWRKLSKEERHAIRMERQGR